VFTLFPLSFISLSQTFAENAGDGDALDRLRDAVSFSLQAFFALIHSETGGNHRNTGTPEHEEIPHIGPEHEESHARHIKTKRTLSSTLIITLDRKRTWTDSSHGVPIGPFIFFQCG
jgi:hypothetical protein